MSLTDKDIKIILQVLQDACSRYLKATLKRMVDAWQQIRNTLRKIFSTYKVKYPMIQKIIPNYTPPVRTIQYQARSNC